MRIKSLFVFSFIIAFCDIAPAQQRIGFNAYGGIGRISNPLESPSDGELRETPGPSIQLAAFYRYEMSDTFFIGAALGMNYLSIFQYTRTSGPILTGEGQSDWHIFNPVLSLHGGFRLRPFECALGLRASSPVYNTLNTSGYGIVNGIRMDYSSTSSIDLENFDLGPELQLGYRFSDNMLFNLVLYHGLVEIFRSNPGSQVRYYQQLVLGIHYNLWQRTSG